MAIRTILELARIDADRAAFDELLWIWHAANPVEHAPGRCAACGTAVEPPVMALPDGAQVCDWPDHACLTDFIPLTGTDETLHPYFDDIEDDQWLYATVVETAPAAVSFFVDPPAQWDGILAARVHRQFRILGLSTLYASHAAVELLNIRHYLCALFDNGGVDQVRAHLTERVASSEAARVYSWQTATYKAFAASEWFCGGGFSLQG